MILWYLVLSTAFAGQGAVAATGGFDYPTAQPWTGLELAIFPDQERGFAAGGRLRSGFGFADAIPLGALDLLATWGIPNDEAVIRFGLDARVGGVWLDRRTPIPLGPIGEEGAPAPGLIPAGTMFIDFEWGTEAPFTFTAAAGAGSIAVAVRCSVEDLTENCQGWRPGFVGGLSARARLKNGLFLHGEVGPSLTASVGYGFPDQALKRALKRFQSTISHRRLR